MMTQYDIQVDLRRKALEDEEWGNRIKYFHFNNGIWEIGYNNGTKEITNLR